MEIYGIRKIGTIGDESIIYVSGTKSNKEVRIWYHNRDYNSGKSTKLYDYIRENGGLESYEFVTIEKSDEDFTTKQVNARVLELLQSGNYPNALNVRFVSSSQRNTYIYEGEEFTSISGLQGRVVKDYSWFTPHYARKFVRGEDLLLSPRALDYGDGELRDLVVNINGNDVRPNLVLETDD